VSAGIYVASAYTATKFKAGGITAEEGIEISKLCVIQGQVRFAELSSESVSIPSGG